MMDAWLILPLMLLFLLLEGFFSGCEMAIVHSDKIHLHHLASRGHKGAMLVLKLFRRPEVLLGTTLVGTNISVVALTTLGTLLMIQLFGEHGDLLALLFYTPLFLILGEVVPKSIYQQKADALAPIIIYPLRLFSFLFYPLVFVFSRSARLVANMFGISTTHHDLFITREQVRLILETAEQAANVDVFDRERLMRVIRFADISAGQVMVPVAELTMLDHRQQTAQVLQLARQRGCFRIPVFRDEPAGIIGAISLSMWDLMDHELIHKPIEALIKPVLFVAPHQPVDELLAELQQRDDHMAIVVDEFGSAIGMLTLEDLMEEIVGEVINIGFNFDRHVPRYKGQIEHLADGVYRMDGRVPLSQAVEVLGIPLPPVEAHTIGGMVLAHLRHIPRQGETVSLSGYRFVIEDASVRAVNRLRVEREQ